MFEWNAPIPMPASKAWTAAIADYCAGHVQRLTMNDDEGEPTKSAATLTWMSAWRTLDLTFEEKVMIRTACVQINQGRIHPALGKTRLLGEPLGCWQVAIHPDILLTWISHWRDRDVPVLLTLERERPDDEGPAPLSLVKG